ncbi:MAG: molybdenum cofactor guanylyltransferase [Zetaproteobacteria bacterium]|nr:molybdenum cofactor guanylyltransferase [Zetaproteobacteria bacterium]
MIHDCTAVILAGGESKRMGQDKASILFQGQTLLQHSIKQLRPCFENVSVSVRKQRSDTDLRQILDNSENRAPMLGIAAALQAVHTDWIFVVGVDMPFVAHKLLKNMASKRENHDAVAVYSGGFMQPLCCFYRQTCWSKMQQSIQAERRSLKHLLKALNTHIISEHEARLYDPKLQSFVSLNTPTDLKTWSKT